MSIYKYKQEVQRLKKELNENEKYFNDEEKNILKKIKEIDELNKINDRYKQEIRELKEKLNDKDDTSEIKSNDDKNKEEIYTDMLYLETEEEAARRIADFHEKKGSGHVNLPVLLSKIYTNNSSKKLISNIEQLINNLYNNKQITKQVYNNLIKTITYKNDS